MTIRKTRFAVGCLALFSGGCTPALDAVAAYKELGTPAATIFTLVGDLPTGRLRTPPRSSLQKPNPYPLIRIPGP